MRWQVVVRLSSKDTRLTSYRPATARLSYAGTFLGAKCTVLGNIEVGKGATVAASALVNKAVPPGYTAVGVPAKLIPPPKGSQFWKPDVTVKAELTGGRERHFERFRQTF